MSERTSQSARSSNSARNRGMHWVWTDHRHKKIDLSFQEEQVKFAVWQLEQGDSTGALHVQGFISFNGKVEFPTVVALLPSSSHIERARHPAKSANYCRKLDSRVEGPWTFGEEPKWRVPRSLRTTTVDEVEDESEVSTTSPLMRKEMKMVLKLIESGCDEDDFMINHTRIYRKYKNEIKHFLLKKRDKLAAEAASKKAVRKNLIVIIGDPGTGKSTLYSELCDNRQITPYFYNGGKWFDGYSPEINSSLFIDEAVAGSVSFTELNKIIDGRAIKQEVKGGTTLLNIDEVAMISNYDIEKLFRKPGTIVEAAFMRRITLLLIMKSFGTEVKFHLELRDKNKPSTAKSDLVADFTYNGENAYDNARAMAKALLRTKGIQKYISIPDDMIDNCISEPELLPELTKQLLNEL